jgi:hypothetical protein
VAEALQREPPGIVRLAATIDEHPGAFAYDWRTRFGLSSSAIGTSMDWAEANLLTVELLKEPDSHVSAALGGWAYPWRAEAIVLADLFDAYVTTHSRHRPAPRPRPWDAPKTKPTRAPASRQAIVLAALARRGHRRREKGD